MFTGPPDDRLAIRELLDTYCDAVTRIALDDYVACWTDNPVRLGTGGEFHGVDALRSHWHSIWTVVERMVFLTQPAAIDVDGDRATARSYCLEMLQFRDGGSQRVVGLYDDTLHRVGGRWLFSERRYRVLSTEGR